MKTISHEQYCRIKAAFTEHVEGREDKYKYLFLTINGYQYKTPRASGERRLNAKLLNISSIKMLWESWETRDALVELAVLRHYRDNIVEVQPLSSQVVLRDDIVRRARVLSDRYKELKAYDDALDN